MTTDGGTQITELTEETFLAGTTGTWTFVDLWASWCAPCRRLAPAYAAAAERWEGVVRFAKVDVDANPGVARLLNVTTIPTVVLFDPDGNEAGRVVNPPAGAFDQLVADVVEKKGLRPTG